MNIRIPMQHIYRFAFFAAILGLVTACKIVINTDDDTTTGSDQTGCNAEATGVKWETLLTEDCPNLSDYNLFSDVSDPTRNPQSRGMPYDLSTQLFTDYASKYRFVFIPEGQQASYRENEAFVFPVGTVIVKTFAMPSDTAFRDGSERLLESRLLIHRADGWVARPYVWFDDQGNDLADARLSITGDVIQLSTVHKGANIDIDYAVPSVTQCTACHNVVPLTNPGPDRPPIFKVIGPKARYLNKPFDYGGIIENQLVHWEAAGLLAGLPSELATVSKAPEFNDLVDVDALSQDELKHAAKAYLDINCAHCHRANLELPPSYGGAAGGTGLRVEWDRSLEEDALAHGICKEPVAGGLDPFIYDVVPQSADASYLLHRINTNDERQRMPELGRSVIHSEGVALIQRWINNLPAASCSP